MRGVLGFLEPAHVDRFDRKSARVPTHTAMRVFSHMFFTIQAHYHMLPDPRSMTTREIVTYYRQLHGTLCRLTRPADG